MRGLLTSATYLKCRNGDSSKHGSFPKENEGSIKQQTQIKQIKKMDGDHCESCEGKAITHAKGGEEKIPSEKFQKIRVSTVSSIKQNDGENYMNFIQTSLKTSVVLLLISGLIYVVPSAVNAEESFSQTSQPAVSQNDLKTFAEAYTEVTQIYNVYENRITKAKEPDQATALQQEANKKMNQAVMDNGLSIEDYNAIYQKIENDPSLQQQFAQVLSQNP